MAGGSRTLKLTILGDVDNLRKSLGDANNATEDSSSKLGDFSKKAGLAFAAAGAAAALYAGKLLIDGVKAAIEDEAAQVRLANALRNTVGATDAQIASTEAFILKTSLATGVADDSLRPALERLTRSTKDIAEAQSLTNLALDIAAAKHLDVEIVAKALAKANDGNVQGLKKLGITLGDNATNLTAYNKENSALEKLLIQQQFVLEESGMKSKAYGDITEKVAKKQEIINALAQQGIDVFGELGKEFAGAASEAADTFAGKMERLKVAFDEGKETVGSFVLDAITPMLTTLVNDVVPAVAELSDKVGNTLQPIFKSLSEFFTGTFVPALQGIWAVIHDLVIPILSDVFKPIIEGVVAVFGKLNDLVTENAGIFKILAVGLGAVLAAAKLLTPFIGGAFKAAFSGIALIIGGVSSAISILVSAINLAISAVNALISAYNVVNNLIPGSKDLPKIPKLAAGGMVSSNNPYIVGELGPELFVPSSSGRIVPNNKLGGGGLVINLTVNGAMDAEGTARTIIDTLNNSFFRGTGGSNNLVTA